MSTLPATVCVNGDGDFHIIFQIANRLSGRKLPNNICFDGLNAEIQGCGNGGENVREGWWIRLVIEPSHVMVFSKECTDLLAPVGLILSLGGVSRKH